MPNSVRVYELPDWGAELHMVGEHVCVRWHCQPERQKVTGSDGIIHLVEVMMRSGQPYIDIVWLRENKHTGEFYLDDDSPVRGGISAEFARQIARELVLAADYLEKIV